MPTALKPPFFRRAAGRFIPKIAAILLLAAGLSCQEPTEPNPTTSGVTITVLATDQGGSPLSRAAVAFSQTASVSGLRDGLTNAGGLLENTAVVQINGGRAQIRVEPPPGEPELAGVQPVTRTVFVPCHDTVYHVVFPRSVVVPCGQTLPPRTFPLLSLCPKTKPRDTVCGPLISHDCPDNVAVSVGAITPAIPGATLVIRGANGAPLGQNFTLAPGAKFEVCMAFAPTAENQPRRAGSVVINGVRQSNGQNFELITLNFAAESRCDECICPPNGFLITEPATPGQFDTVCTAQTGGQLISIPLGSVRNTNALCTMVFTPVRGISPPNSADLRLISFNGSSFELPPGAALSTLELLFSPSSARQYLETLTYAISLVTSDGRTIRCDSALTVEFRGLGSDGACIIDVQRSTLLRKPLTTPPDTDTLFQRMDQSVDPGKTICIRNQSTKCPLTVTNIALSGPEASVFKIDPASFPMTISPNATQCFTVGFFPTVNDYWDRGRGNLPPDSIFNATLDIATTGACSITQLPVHGKVIPPDFNANCLQEWGRNFYKAGMFFTEKGEIIFRPEDVRDSLAVTVSGFDNTAAPTRATLFSKDFCYFKPAGKLNLANGNICDFRNNYVADCPSRTGFGNPGNGYVPTLDVTVGDVVLVSYFRDGQTLCAVMIITDIGLDKRPQVGTGQPQVCFQLCFPI
jgi:hypothetical protein